MSSHETPYQEFCRQFEGHEALNAETGYALPELLIKAITKCAPKFFRKEELEFERKLAQLPATGWCYRGLFSYPLLSHLHPQRKDPIPELRSSQAEERNRRHQATRQAMHSNFIRIARGYAGWLATHAAFREEVRTLKEKWEPLIKQASGMFPAVRQTVLGYSPPQDRYWYSSPESPKQRSARISRSRKSGQPPRLTRKQQLAGDFMVMHDDWSLERLSTWELPVPLTLEVNQSQIYDANHLSSQAGVLLYVPWYVLIQKDLKLQDLIKNRNKTATSGVMDWLSQANHAKFGVDRYGNMLQLYVYLELALKQRYGSELRKSTVKLDEAFARFFSATQSKSVQLEAVRRVRLEMMRRLRAPAK